MSIESLRVTAILLAAGRSERFGGNKLIESLSDMPLIQHAARSLSSIPFARRIAVVSEHAIDVSGLGFSLIRAPTGGGLSTSIAAGVAAAQAIDCDACLIALGDMPFVPEAHFLNLMEAHESECTATASRGLRMVPALFARALFPALQALSGDRGASALLAQATAVDANAAWLEDVDTRDDLSRLNAETR